MLQFRLPRLSISDRGSEELYGKCV